MQIGGCSSTKNLKKEPQKNCDCKEIKKEYNELLHDFNKLAALESECNKLNQDLATAAEVNSDLLNKINQENKEIRTNNILAIILIGILATGLVAGGIAVGVKLNK